MNLQKLTCGPAPPPTCVRIDGQLACTAPPLRCIATCDAPGECVTLCCASFAPDPIPTLSPIALVTVVVLVALVAAFVGRRHAGH